MTQYSKEILRMAIITALLIGIFSSLPMYMIQLIGQKKGIFVGGKINIGGSLLMISLLVCFLWTLNVWLLNQYERRFPDTFYKKNSRYIISSLGVLPIVFGIVFLIKLLIVGNPPPPLEHPILPFLPIFGILSTNFIVLTMLDLIVLRHKEANARIENEQLKRLNAEAKHTQLQHQLQPHFLFNALATLKSLIKKQPQAAENYVFQLSQLLRSTLSAQSQSVVAIGIELETAMVYLALQNTRFDDSIQITIADEVLSLNGKLPHLSLLTLVENAIKHTQFNKEKPLQIEIQVKEGRLLEIKNTSYHKQQQETNMGIGLSNLQQRYRLLASKYEILIAQDSHFFQVSLPIIFD